MPRSRLAPFKNLSSWVLPVAMVLYLFLMGPQFGGSVFTYDSFYNIWRARMLPENPLLIFEPSFGVRFGPLYNLFWFFMDRFFGFNAALYGWINGSLHVLNSALLFWFLRRLIGPSKVPAVLGSLFFLFSSTQWGVLWEVGQTMRLASTFLSLSSLLFFVRFLLYGKKIEGLLSLLLFIGTFGFCEDAITLPLLLVTIMFLIPPRRISWVETLVLTLPFFLVSSMVALRFLFLKGLEEGWIKIGAHVFVNQLFLIKDLAQFLLVPHRELVPLEGAWAVLLRLAPAFFVCFLAGILWNCKKDQILHTPLRPSIPRLLVLGAAWIGITSFLYALRPMAGVWQGRYLYIPGIGEAIVVGVLLYLVGRSLVGPGRKIPAGIQRFLRGGFLTILFYGWGLNLVTTLSMIHKARSGIPFATPEELPVIFSVVSEIRDQLGAPFEIPPDTILVVEGFQIPLARLKELLGIYYASVPAMIVEAASERALTTFPPGSGYT